MSVLRPAILAVAVTAAGLSQAQPITTYPAPTGINPAGIAVSPDGTTWFSATDGGYVFRIDEAGVLSSFSGFNQGGSYALAFGPDKRLWAPDGAGGVSRIAPDGSATFLMRPSGTWGTSVLGGIAWGIDGAMWFSATGNPDNQIVRVTVSGAFSEAQLEYARGGGPLLLGPDGNIWYGGAGEIGRVTPTRVVTTFPLPSYVSVRGLAVGPDGAIWFTETPGRKIGRITLSGDITEFEIPNVDAQPNSIVAGPDGALWFSTYLPVIGRLTTAGLYSEIAVPTNGPNNYVFGLAVAPDGGIWYTNPPGHMVGRFYPSTLRSLLFYPVTPCRIIDTRQSTPVQATEPWRFVSVFASPCGIPPDARSLALNVTVAEPSKSGEIRLINDVFVPGPTTTVAFRAGQIRASNTVIGLPWNGSGALGIENSSGGTVHVIVDTVGFFK